jgi:hypothetical protein
MEAEATPDFSGYATKAGLKCSDGRTIMPDAFKHQDKATVPLVWQHNHNDPGNVLGHALLEHRDDGIYAYGFFNETDQAKNARLLVEHGDIKSLSIYANQLTEKAKQVFHGFIREMSLVLSGANPGALIDNITLAHADGDMVTLEDEAVIYTGLELSHASSDSSGDTSTTDAEDAAEDSADDEAPESEIGQTVQEVYDSMTDEQKDVVHYMVGAALEGDVEDIQEAEEPLEDDQAAHSNSSNGHEASNVSNDDNEKEGRRMTRNVFEQSGDTAVKEERHTLTHDAMRGIVTDAQKMGSLKDAVEKYALQHGIENIDTLFPPEKSITDTPEFQTRRIEWVAGVIDGTRHVPFSRIKSLSADLTFEEARAKGYIKGTMKKEEFFGVSKRITWPTTIYKKQKLDRDDVLDITDFDVVVWLKAEMRLMLDEEIARAILIGDGRDVADEDKVQDPAGASQGAGIRAIAKDDDLYAVTVNVNLGDANSSPNEIVDEIVRASRFYRGSGSPTLYTTLPILNSILLTRDTLGRRIYSTVVDVAAQMNVAKIVTVEAMESDSTLVGIIVNLTDYAVGTDKGGEVNFFDFFDIDYNQFKYMLETRCSGALTKIRSALVVRSTASANVLVTPNAPSYSTSSNQITINATTGVTYKRTDTGATVVSPPPIAVAAGTALTIQATPNAGYYFETNADDEWTFENL